MKLKLAIIALVTILVCGFSITSVSLAPSPALAGDDNGGDSDDAADGNGTGGGPGKDGD